MDLINQTKILNIDQKKYAFDTYHLLLCEINEVYEACIQCMQNHQSIESLYSKFDKDLVENANRELKEFIDAGLFFSKNINTYDYFKANSVGCFSFPPQHNCNLACKYCFAKHGNNYVGKNINFPDKTLEQSFRFVCQELFPELKKYRIDFVSGGEPLLNFDIIIKTASLRNKYQEATGKPIDIFLATNATLLTKEHLDFFNKNNINLGISLDGDQIAHDSCRVYANSKGTYHQVLHSINEILTNPTLSRRLKNIWGLSVLHARNLDVVKILRHHHRVGLQSVQMKVVRLDKANPFSVNERNIEELIIHYESLTEAIIDELRNGKTILINMFLNDNDYFGKILRRLLSRTPVIYRCGAGKNKISICANGDIYPCDSFVGNNRFKLGNVFDPINDCLMDMFYKYSIYTNEKCKNCWIHHLCGGDCYQNSYLTNNKIGDPDEIICYLNMHLAEMAIRILIEVEKDEQLKQYFDRILHARLSTY